ncbi:UPF0149 family protein [Pseudoalteromonas sp. MMG010]|uniref:UPF0149 family protein n=1 Tax=Pseudoalteromonas sp. MMG010 TaxID=2822685 RepID=UPI001B3A75E1|nr:UPF0149 family protein [Pseudoalteromonas sp. MMG010]MBQ4834159.1 UPF0149 family protein [Pseudoalteromonas sp. MMG010]
MHFPEFTEQHIQQLTAFLAEQPNSMTFSQSEGYLFAVICSPEPLEVHQWMANIIADENAVGEETLFLFMALYHKISEAVFNTGYKLPAAFNAQCMSQWCNGFITGSSAYSDKLLKQTQLPAEYVQALSSAQASLSFFALTSEAITEIAKQNNMSKERLIEQQYDLMKDFSLGYAELIEVVAVNSGLYTDDGWE